MPKRYVLFMADDDLSEDDLGELSRVLKARHGDLKVIPVNGNERAVIVKTTARVVAQIRETGGVLSVRGRQVTAAKTSGAIGKLKRRARGAEMSDHGQVHE